MSTKQRILDEALTLFAEKGFSAVTVNDIAEAVGIKAPSLYKHYKGKQEIFNSCVEIFIDRLEQFRNKIFLANMSEQRKLGRTPEQKIIVDFAINLFMFYLRDEVASKIRRVLLIDRYRNEESNKLYEAMFLNNAVEVEERLFSELMSVGILKEGNPHNIALQFYSPILYLVEKYDMHPDKDEEARQEIADIVTAFYVQHTRTKV